MKVNIPERLAMTSTERFEISQRANQLRSNQEYDGALKLYRDLCADKFDEYAAAGLLYCLRKLGSYDEALCFVSKYSDEQVSCDWFKNEIIQVLLDGKLKKIDEHTSFDEVMETAERIINLNPRDSWKKWFAIRTVAKHAKSKRNWQLVLQWTGFIDPQILSTVPMKDARGHDGWCDKALWYNYRIPALIAIGDQEKAISLSQDALSLFPRQAKFFARLEALANLRLERFAEAERLYAKISTRWNDWWILYEYGQALQGLDNKEVALEAMCRAALANNKYEGMVSLFFDIASICMDLNLQEAAKRHLYLCRKLREQQNWPIPDALVSAITKVNAGDTNVASEKDYDTLLDDCREFWQIKCGIQAGQKTIAKKSVQRALKGNIRSISPDKPYCFIFAGQDSYFCSKDDLPIGVNQNTLLLFDAVPSFDKKKNKESWKAVNIRIA